jgi:hypothetical protein
VPRSRRAGDAALPASRRAINRPENPRGKGANRLGADAGEERKRVAEPHDVCARVFYGLPKIAVFREDAALLAGLALEAGLPMICEWGNMVGEGMSYVLQCQAP